jgi:Protein of unknown function (DUF2917)
MDEYLLQSPFSVSRGSLLRIDGGAGVLVHVWAGEIWLTQEGSGKDHVLGAGQSFRLDRGGAALAHAFSRSVVSLTPPAPRPSPLAAWMAKLLEPIHRPDSTAF